MEFPAPLQPARLIRRYKRFLADIRLPDGSEAVAHCPNPGSMQGLAEPGTPILVMPAAARGGARLPWSWKLVELGGGHLAGIDATLPNRVVAEALRAGAIPALAGYREIAAEVTLAPGTRIDFRLSAPDRPPMWLEVKNVHLRRTGDLAEFPDSVTRRGARHLEALAHAVARGERAAMLYVVQRTDCRRFGLARDIDPAYGSAFAAAHAAGVTMLCHATRITPGGVWLDAPLPVELPC
ncbi:MAG: DNA/RNA nuclease SfsA [Alphaproteobacteria bacterium]|nr:MAG: DNA/RNA nuclease SfsA [Alphaproteobacteria bacterium]